MFIAFSGILNKVRQRFPIAVYHLRIPMGRVFQYPFLCFIINVNHSKSFLISFCPFEIIKDRPMKITLYRYLLAHTRKFHKIPLSEIYPLWIMHTAIKRNPILIRQTIFCDNDRQAVSFKIVTRTPV